MRRILAIIPFVVDRELADEHLRTLEIQSQRDTTITIAHLNKGPKISDYGKEGFQHGVSETVEIVVSNQSRYDGILISCFEDPGVHEARAIATIPVVGPGESSMIMASRLANKFNIISPDEPAERILRGMAKSMGLEDQFGVFELISTDVSEFNNQSNTVVSEVASAIRRAEEKCQNAVNILGCTGFADIQNDIADSVDVPILDSVTASISMLESLIDVSSRGEPE